MSGAWLAGAARDATLALELVALIPALYLAVVALCAVVRVRSGATRLSARAGKGSGAPPRFAVVVPAHDEAEVIAQTLASLAALDYPADAVDRYVIADNCADTTEAIVARSGVATVLPRHDTAQRGKGYALAWAFEQLASHTPSYDAYVVIDADTVARPNLLRVFAAHIAAGADAAQARYSTLNGGANARTALRWLALTLVNYVRPLGRGALGGNCTLTGNGMLFTARLLQRRPWTAFGLTEDYQYYLTLTLAGERVRFAPETEVSALMPTTAAAMRVQDVRWESSGAGPSTWAWARRLLAVGLRRRAWPCLEAALELLTPPLSQLLATLVVCMLSAALLGGVAQRALALALLACVLAYVGSALLVEQAPRALYRAVLLAPAFIAWKLWVLVALRGRASHAGEWVRTSRADVSR